MSMDPYLHEMDREPRPRPQRGPSPQELDLFAGSDTDSGNTTVPDAVGNSIAAPREPEPWRFMGDVPDDCPAFPELVRIGREFAVRNGYQGVTVGEVVYEYERSGRRVGGVKMESETLEQRQTSWMPRAMRAAGLRCTDDRPYRPSPVERQHRHKQPPWVLPEFAREDAA